MRKVVWLLLVLVLATFAVACARSVNPDDRFADCGFINVNTDISEKNFPPSGSGANVSDMLAVSHEDLGDVYMTNTETENAIERKGWRSATLDEQLAYAQAKWNGKDTIVALGSLWKSPEGGYLAPIMFGNKVGRNLDLIWEDSGIAWGGGPDGLLFLVVRK